MAIVIKDIIHMYINYANKLGHKYTQIDWNDDIHSGFVNRKFYNKTITKQQIIDTVSKECFIKQFINYKCISCDTILVFDNGASISSVRHIKNGKAIDQQEFDSYNQDFKESISKGIFHLTCNDIMIKNLLE